MMSPHQFQMNFYPALSLRDGGCGASLLLNFLFVNLIPPLFFFSGDKQSLENPLLEGNQSFSVSSPVRCENVAKNLSFFLLISAKATGVISLALISRFPSLGLMLDHFHIKLCAKVQFIEHLQDLRGYLFHIQMIVMIILRVNLLFKVTESVTYTLM